MPYAISLRLDDSGAGAVEAMWETLRRDGISDAMPRLRYRPHVTLGVFDDLEPGQAVAVLQRLHAERLPIAVAFAGLAVFPGAASVLWAAPVPSRELIAMHGELHDALPLPCREHYRVGRWVPHCTLAQDLDGVRLRAALDRLLRDWRPFAATFDRLDLVRFTPVEVLWESGGEDTVAG